MKTLNQHIQEKLIINKNFKNDNNFKYKQIKPNKKGKCLRLSVPKTKEKNQIEFINVFDYEYDYIGDIVYCEPFEFKQNVEGYYTEIEKIGSNSICVLLFNEDAITFLNQLLINPEAKVDIEEICASSMERTDEYKFVCKADNEDFFIKPEIEYIIKQIR